MRITNTSAVDGWHVPLYGLNLAPGESVEVSDDLASMEVSAPVEVHAVTEETSSGS